jgi:hypothetical protein
MTKAKQQQAPQIVPRPIEALIPYARNARTHSDEQVALIAASLREFGWTNPVLVDAEGGIIDAAPTGSGQVIDFSNVEFFGTMPDDATIAWGPASPTHSASGGFLVRFARCWGLTTDRLELATGSSLSWANSTWGLVEWDMRNATQGHVQWRNEIRGSSGLGTCPVRTTLDTDEWQVPGT